MRPTPAATSRTRYHLPANTTSVKIHCGRLPGATTKLYAPPVNVLSYQVGGNTFASFKDERARALAVQHTW